MVEVEAGELARMRAIVEQVEQAAGAEMPAYGSGATAAAAAARSEFAKGILDRARGESAEPPVTSQTDRTKSRS
jgi:hypothetical protein